MGPADLLRAPGRATVTAAGNSSPPPGLRLNRGTGLLSGTPTATGNFPFTGALKAGGVLAAIARLVSGDYLATLLDAQGLAVK